MIKSTYSREDLVSNNINNGGISRNCLEKGVELCWPPPNPGAVPGVSFAIGCVVESNVIVALGGILDYR